MRPAWKAIGLCDLFAIKPDLADAWAAGEFGKFTPKAVREELGIESFKRSEVVCEECGWRAIEDHGTPVPPRCTSPREAANLLRCR